MQNQEAALNSLENQVGQISQVLNTRQQGGFLNDNEVAKGATHEQCKAISTRSGKILTTPNQNKQGEKTIDNPNAATIPDEPTLAKEPVATGKDQDTPPPQEETDHTEATLQPKLPTLETLKDIRQPPPFPQRLEKLKQVLEHFETGTWCIEKPEYGSSRLPLQQKLA
ncbi:hypothetical protein V6N13_037320 [Hibiscus sabdariffa]